MKLWKLDFNIAFKNIWNIPEESILNIIIQPLTAIEWKFVSIQVMKCQWLVLDEQSIIGPELFRSINV
jgi:hypothetical protein